MPNDVGYKFEKIYKKELHAIFRFCLIRVSNKDQAMDLAQETFLRLWQSLSSKKEDIRNSKAFLFTIAHRLIIDWYRKKKSVSLDGILYEGNAKYDLADETIVGDTELAAEGRYLFHALNKVTFTCQYPIYLRYAEGLSPKEIGNILGITANSASVRINRGIQELRRRAGYDLVTKMV